MEVLRQEFETARGGENDEVCFEGLDLIQTRLLTGIQPRVVQKMLEFVDVTGDGREKKDHCPAEEFVVLEVNVRFDAFEKDDIFGD